jgi:hypothetical protein
MSTQHINLHGKSIELPDALMSLSGERIRSAVAWHEQRRPEILELFRRYVYGRAPAEKPHDLRFEILEKQPILNGQALLKRIAIRFAGRECEYSKERKTGTIPLSLLVPHQAGRRVPCFLFLNNREPELADPLRRTRSDFWPAENILAHGYATAVIQLSDIDPDFHDDFQNGVHGLLDPPDQRPKDAWGTIGAWAWGACRALDYLVTDEDINTQQIAVVGHSRGGKTALWAGAQDERFALVVSNESGSTGAALARGKKGETIADINRVFRHWFCETYRDFNGREDQLPVDQHQLLSLIAPRLLYIASAIEDEWCDPQAEFAAGVAASPVYELLGQHGLSGEFPPLDQPQHSGRIGYHVRRGGHDLTLFDWEQFLNFADRHLKQNEG